MDTDDHKSPFSEWIRSPQTMIALSAVLLSVCGLFISIYETSLIREQQRASVWPNVEIAPSINPGDLKIFVQNTGVGPARIQTASVIYKDDVKADWGEVVRAIKYDKVDNMSSYQSLINGRVLPFNSNQELIFRIQSPSDKPESDLAGKLSKAILNEELDVRLCYCSVYDECWTASMLDVTKRAQGKAVLTREERKVERCLGIEGIEESGI